MLNRTDFPQSIRAEIEVRFNEGFTSKPLGGWDRLIEVVPSPSNAKTEVFYGTKNSMRRWRGERQPQKFNEYKMELVGDRWEHTHSIDRAELNRDQSGGILLRKAQSFGADTAYDRYRLFWEFLRNGVSVQGFDKHPLFGPTHRYVTSSGVTITAVAAQSNVQWGGSQLDATTLQLERQHYSELVTDTNKSWGLKLTDVAVYEGSANHKNAMELSNSQFTVEANTVKGQMTENVFKGSFNIITTTEGIGASEWISFALDNSDMKPVKVLSETNNPGFENPKFTTNGFDSLSGGTEESDSAFWRGEVNMGIESNFGYNPGYWMTANMHGSSTYSGFVTDYEDQQIVYPNLG